MKVLAEKLLYFLGLLLVIKLAFVLIFGDKFIYEEIGAGGNQYEVEYRKGEFAKEPYDTVFIGSSRTALGISPAYFDLLTGKTKSYNFGIIAGKPPQTFDWCAELMQTKPLLKYVFFELSGGLSEDTSNSNNQVLTFFKPSIPQNEFENANQGLKLPLQNIPLEKFLARKSVPAVASRIFSLEDVRLSRLRNMQVEEAGMINNQYPTLNEDYWKRVVALTQIAETKQIRLYFFIPPRLKNDRELELIFPIYQKLEDKYKLKFAHYDESLYQADSSLDNIHLNHQGAKKLTEMVAQKFKDQNL